VTDRLALTVREAAAALGVGKDAIYKAINRGELRAVRLGGTLLVPQAELDRMLGVASSPEPMAIAALLREVAHALEPAAPKSRIDR
jgi:excisionase family DNA binding protein